MDDKLIEFRTAQLAKELGFNEDCFYHYNTDGCLCENNVMMNKKYIATHAKKVIADAEGFAKSTLLKADAQAKANNLLQSSISQNLIEYEKIKKWNGQLPTVTGSNAIINLK